MSNAAVQFTGTSVSALYQILAEKDQPDGYVGLDANGKIPVAYLPDEIPKDFTDVEIRSNKNQANGYAGLDAGGQLLASVIPAGSYILSSDKGAVNGVAPLDGTGTIFYSDLPTGTTSTSVAIGNHSHSGEFVLRTDVNAVNGVAGLDGVGKLAIATIPTGSTSNTVAFGNHGHAGQFEPIINPKRTAFNSDFGTSAGQVSEGNHTHDAAVITTGKIAFARLPVGAVANTISEGNHTHLNFGNLSVTGTLTVGSGNDVTLAHDGTTTIFQSLTSDLLFRQLKSGGQVIFDGFTSGSVLTNFLTFDSNEFLVSPPARFNALSASTVEVRDTDPANSNVLIEYPLAAYDSTEVLTQGSYYAWNLSPLDAGNGSVWGGTEFINSKGLGSGGFKFWNRASEAGESLQFLAAINAGGGIFCTSLHPANGANGSFVSQDGKTVTVTNGIITSIV